MASTLVQLAKLVALLQLTHLPALAISALAEPAAAPLFLVLGF